jgi:hypothetical protein
MVAPPGNRQGEAQAAKGRANRSGGTGRSGSGFGAYSQDRMNAALDPMGTRSQKIGKGLAKRGGTGKTADLPSGLNPAKYTPNPTITAPLTLENVGTLISNVNDVMNPAAAMLKAGMGMAGVPGFDDEPLSGFEGPIGQTTRGDYDGSDIERADDLGPVAPPAIKKKKTPAKPPGFSLLEGAGGTLLGS